jgi:hypothetical protein
MTSNLIRSNEMFYHQLIHIKILKQVYYYFEFIYQIKLNNIIVVVFFYWDDKMKSYML